MAEIKEEIKKSKIKDFIYGLFLDDTNEPCMGRFALFLGLILLPITAIWNLDTEGEISMWEAVVRTSPALTGLIAYVFTRLYECREWVAEVAKGLKKR